MVAAEAPEITVAFQIVKQRKREDQGANSVSPAAKLPSNTFPRNHTLHFHSCSISHPYLKEEGWLCCCLLTKSYPTLLQLHGL